MDISSTFSAVRVLYDCLIKGKPNFAQIKPHPAKTRLLSPVKESFFPKARPARVGVDGEKLYRFAREISEERAASVHAVTVIARGKCVFEAARAGYSTAMPHAAFSLSKTLTGLAVGLLADDGRLATTDTVLSFFPELAGKRQVAKFKAMTVEHLLSMSADIPFNEIGVVCSENYTKSFFSSSLRSPLGEGFFYNSMCSYILAEIVTRIAGASLSDFLSARILLPMGIQNYFWEKSSEGVEKGGWGLYLSTRSMAKIGQLFLSGGVWQGKRLISASWIARMTEKHTSVPDKTGPFDYGYHIWCHKEDGSILLNGMLGQNVWIQPKLGLVVAITAGDSCLFQDAFSLMSAMRHLKNMTGHDTRALAKARRHIARHFGEKGALIPPYVSHENHDARDMLFPALYGPFSVPENNGGVLPLITRLVQNSPTAGISSLTIHKIDKKETLLFTFIEGKAKYRIKAGNCRFAESVLSVHGEVYRVTAAYAMGLDEEREPYLRLELRFPALAGTRRFLFRRDGDGFSVVLSEQPGYEFVQKLLKNASEEKNDLIEALTKTNSPLAPLLRRVSNIFAPTLKLTHTGIKKTDATATKKG